MAVGTASLVIGGLSALANLLGPIIGGQQQPQDINPYTADFMSQMQALASQSAAQAGEARGDIRSAESDQRRTAGQIGGLRQDIQDLDAPDPNDFFGQFLGNIPGYREIAQATAEQAGLVAGRTAEENAQVASQQAAQNAARATPGGAGFSGAQATAVGQAAANPLAEALNQISQMNAQNYSSTFNQLAGQGQGLAFQGQQQGFENALGQLQSQLGALGQLGALQGQLAGQATNRLGQANQGQQFALGQFGQNAGPAYSTPTTFNPLGSTAQGLGQFSQLLALAGAQTAPPPTYGTGTGGGNSYALPY